GFYWAEGVGLRGLVLVAAGAPRPPLAGWLRDLGDLPWKTAEAAGVWRFDGRSFETDTEVQRGEVRRLADVPGPLEAACRAFQSRPGVEAIRALAFPVLPQPGAPAPAAPAPGASAPAGGARTLGVQPRTHPRPTS